MGSVYRVLIGQSSSVATWALFLGAPIWATGGWDLPIVVNVLRAHGSNNAAKKRK